MRPLMILLYAAAAATGLGTAVAATPEKGKPPPTTTVTSRTTVPRTTTVSSTTTVSRTTTAAVPTNSVKTERTTTARPKPPAGSTVSGGSSPGQTVTQTVTQTTTMIVRVPLALQGIARFREVQTSHSAQGALPGSIETWRTRVLLTTRRMTVGTGSFVCVRTDRLTSSRNCFGTYILPRGRMQLAGEVVSIKAFQLTITGGTGVYVDAGGLGVFTGRGGVRSVVFYLTGPR